MKRTSIGFKSLLTLSIYLFLTGSVRATNYTVATLSSLVSSMSAAVGGDTIIVSNGTYNWGKSILPIITTIWVANGLKSKLVKR